MNACSEEEKACVKELEASVDAWWRSRRVRAYLAAGEASADLNDGALQSWLAWSREYVNWTP